MVINRKYMRSFGLCAAIFGSYILAEDGVTTKKEDVIFMESVLEWPVNEEGKVIPSVCLGGSSVSIEPLYKYRDIKNDEYLNMLTYSGKEVYESTVHKLLGVSQGSADSSLEAGHPAKKAQAIGDHNDTNEREKVYIGVTLRYLYKLCNSAHIFFEVEYFKDKHTVYKIFKTSPLKELSSSGWAASLYLGNPFCRSCIGEGSLVISSAIGGEYRCFEKEMQSNVCTAKDMVIASKASIYNCCHSHVQTEASFKLGLLSRSLDARSGCCALSKSELPPREFFVLVGTGFRGSYETRVGLEISLNVGLEYLFLANCSGVKTTNDENQDVGIFPKNDGILNVSVGLQYYW